MSPGPPPPWKRTLRPTGAGSVFTAGSLAVGLAAVNTGNNLLFLLLGSMLGVLVAGGWLSEQLLKKLQVRRSVPRGCHANEEGVLRYTLVNQSTWVTGIGLQINESGVPAEGWLGGIPPNATREVLAPVQPTERGVHPLQAVSVTTAFPFGLFRKSRQLQLQGEWRVWPALIPEADDLPAMGSSQMEVEPARTTRPAGSARGEFRSLREYRWGDAPTDVHWLASARRGELVVREYQRPDTRGRWLRLDLARSPGMEAERTLSHLASHLRRGEMEGEPLGIVSQAGIVAPWTLGQGPEAALDFLAEVRFDPSLPPLEEHHEP